MPGQFEIIQCKKCGAKNRVPSDRGHAVIKCGKCHESLGIDRKDGHRVGVYKMRCSHCSAKNRIPGTKIDSGAKCGKCGESLQTHELFIPQPVMITESNFEDKVMKSPLPVLLFAWASW